MNSNSNSHGAHKQLSYGNGLNGDGVMECRPEASLLWPSVMYVGQVEAEIAVEKKILLVYSAVCCLA